MHRFCNTGRLHFDLDVPGDLLRFHRRFRAFGASNTIGEHHPVGFVWRLYHGVFRIGEACVDIVSDCHFGLRRRRGDPTWGHTLSDFFL